MAYKPWFRPEYVDRESEDICLAHDNNKAARRALERAQVILRNMADERPGFWASLFGRRWLISHEPLRADARNALPEINAAICRLTHEGQSDA